MKHPTYEQSTLICSWVSPCVTFPSLKQLGAINELLHFLRFYSFEYSWLLVLFIIMIVISPKALIITLTTKYAELRVECTHQHQHKAIINYTTQRDSNDLPIIGCSSFIPCHISALLNSRSFPLSSCALHNATSDNRSASFHRSGLNRIECHARAAISQIVEFRFA